MKKPSQDYRSPYCLHCYTPVERFKGASEPCPACDRPIVKADFGRLWTRERKLKELEDLLKTLVVVAMTIVGALALLYPGIGVGRGQGMAIGAPIVIGVLLWDVASITRQRSLFRADIIWPIIGLLLGPIFLMFTLALAKDEGREVYYVWAGLTVAIMVPAILSPLLRRWWSSWRARHIAEAQRGPAQLDTATG